MLIKALAVFCGSQDGRQVVFSTAARELGQWMARHRVRLVYGGGNVGLMGTIANAVLEGGGVVTGVIPQLLDQRERSHKLLTELLIVEDMHTRKKLMYERCDAAVILPGGFGTLDEFFEMVTWNNLSIHNKEIFLLNIHHYYDHLLTHMQTMYENGFLYENPLERIRVFEGVTALLNYLENP
ncbi:TIGR00730 family Rossman fold protein [Niabella terrae]